MQLVRHCMLAWSVVVVAAGSTARAAEPASRPFATIVDDGTFAKDFTRSSTVQKTAKKVLKKYEAAGQKRPDVLSVWTTFPMAGTDLVTLFLPLRSEVRGIGVETVYGGNGTFADETTAPVRAILLHNNIRALKDRAKYNGTSEEGFADYLFLLELSHLWGPAARVPAKEGVSADGLIGFDFHWSFWMDAGGSPAGGNIWRDNKDGTFTTAPQRPGEITFSMLDLYLMGMASPAEVPPFGVLTQAQVIGKHVDPMSGRAVGKTTFPWFDSAPLTVKATRVPYTVEEIIAANGERVPQLDAAPKSFTLGIALMVGRGTSDDERRQYESLMDRIAVRLAPAFERATRGRGKLDVVSSVIPAAATPSAPEESLVPTTSPSQPRQVDDGCTLAPVPARSSAAPWLAAVAALVAIVRARRRGCFR